MMVFRSGPCLTARIFCRELENRSDSFIAKPGLSRNLRFACDSNFECSVLDCINQPISYLSDLKKILIIGTRVKSINASIWFGKDRHTCDQ